MSSSAPMMVPVSRRICSVLFAFALVPAGCRAQAPATEPTSDDEAAADEANGSEHRRIVAVGDLHGDLDATLAVLRLAELIDDEGSWVGGDAVLVQTGDQLDRGDDEPEILALLERLEEEAQEEGGEVIVLIGNHEAMNVALDLRYVTDEGFEDYADFEDTMPVPLAERTPEPARGRVGAFMPGGPVARSLAEHPIIAVVEGNVFVHGGLHSHHVAYGFERLNEEAAAWMRGEAPMPALLQAPDGPLWTRELSMDTDAADCEALARALDEAEAERVIVGHTVQPEGPTSACNGQVWRIDVGLSSHYGGAPAALEIRGDEVRVLR